MTTLFIIDRLCEKYYETRKGDYIKVLYQSYLFGNLGRFSSSLVVLVEGEKHWLILAGIALSKTEN